MKQQSTAVLKYSGYPLFIADKKNQVVDAAKNNLFVFKTNTKPITDIKEIVNDPINWDETWFCNYE